MPRTLILAALLTVLATPGCRGLTHIFGSENVASANDRGDDEDFHEIDFPDACLDELEVADACIYDALGDGEDVSDAELDAALAECAAEENALNACLEQHE